MSFLTDASDQTAEAADAALHELYDGRDEWADDARPTRNEIEREEYGQRWWDE